MPVAALLLVITAAFAHATWNFLIKGARNDLPFQFAATVVSSVAYLPALIVAIVVAEDG